MLSLSEYRQKTLSESIVQNNVSIEDAINMHLDLLKLKIYENTRLPNTILSEHKLPDFYLEKFLAEEQSECKNLVYSIIDEHRSGIIALLEDAAPAGTGNPKVDKWGEKLNRRIAKYMDDLAKKVSSAMGNYGAPPSGGPMGSGPAPSGGGPMGGGSAPSGPAPTGGGPTSSGGSAPSGSPAPTGPAPMGGPAGKGSTPAKSFWKQLFTHPIASAKNIGKGIARGARRLIHDDPTMESVNEVLLERNNSIVGEIEKVKKALIAYVNKKLPKLVAGIGSPTPSAPNAPAPVSPEGTPDSPAPVSPEGSPDSPVDPPIDSAGATVMPSKTNVAAEEEPIEGDGQGDLPQEPLAGSDIDDDWSPHVVGKTSKQAVDKILQQFGAKIAPNDPRFQQGAAGFIAGTNTSWVKVTNAVLDAIVAHYGLENHEAARNKLRWEPNGTAKARALSLLGHVSGMYGFKIPYVKAKTPEEVAVKQAIDKGEDKGEEVANTTNVNAPEDSNEQEPEKSDLEKQIDRMNQEKEARKQKKASEDLGDAESVPTPQDSESPENEPVEDVPEETPEEDDTPWGKYKNHDLFKGAMEEFEQAGVEMDPEFELEILMAIQDLEEESYDEFENAEARMAINDKVDKKIEELKAGSEIDSGTSSEVGGTQSSIPQMPQSSSSPLGDRVRRRTQSIGERVKDLRGKLISD